MSNQISIKSKKQKEKIVFESNFYGSRSSNFNQIILSLFLQQCLKFVSLNKINANADGAIVSYNLGNKGKSGFTIPLY